MTLATVMVSLAFDASNDARLEVAGELAERFDAGIIGVAAAQFTPPLYFTDGQMAQDLIDQGQASIRERLAELEVQFRDAIKNRAKYVEWRSALDFPAASSSRRRVAPTSSSPAARVRRSPMPSRWRARRIW